MRIGTVFLFILFLFLPLSAYAHEKVVLQLQWLPQFQFAGYYIAKEKGFYADAGLDVEIRPMQPGMDVAEQCSTFRAIFSVLKK